MSNPRHRAETGRQAAAPEESTTEPAAPEPPIRSTIDFTAYPPPINMRSIDFEAVAPVRTEPISVPPQYVVVPTAVRPSGLGPDQWAEAPTPQSVVADITPSSDDLESGDLEFAHS